jgi:hypothetical protein
MVIFFLGFAAGIIFVILMLVANIYKWFRYRK